MVLHPFAQVIEMDVTMALWYSVRGRNLEPQDLDKKKLEDELPFVCLCHKKCANQMGFSGLSFLDSSSCRAFLTLCVETKTPWKPLSSMRSSFHSGSP